MLVLMEEVKMSTSPAQKLIRIQEAASKAAYEAIKKPANLSLAKAGQQAVTPVNTLHAKLRAEYTPEDALVDHATKLEQCIGVMIILAATWILGVMLYAAL